MKWLCKPLLTCLLLGAWIAPGYALSDGEAKELLSQAAAGDASALQALEQAAAQGFAMAQYNLGVLYESGQGVQQDKQAAKEWFGKACDARVQLGCDKYRKLNEAGV